MPILPLTPFPLIARPVGVLVAVALMAGGATLTAQTVDLSPVADAAIYEPNDECSNPSVDAAANGAGDYLFVGRTAGGGGNSLRRSLLRFDVASAIPAGAAVESVSLSLTVDKVPPTVGGFTTQLRSVQADWNEGPTDAGIPGGEGDTSVNGDVTWCDREVGSAEWSSPGGDYGPEVVGSVLMTDVGPYEVPSSPSMVAAVQAWLDQPSTNYGWLLRGGEGFGSVPSAKRLASREAISGGPMLTVTYSVPQTSPLQIPMGGGLAALFLAAALAWAGVRWLRSA